MNHLIAATETVGVGAVIGLLTGAVTLLGTILRYARKAWLAVDGILTRINDTARKLEQVEGRVNYILQHGSLPEQNVKEKVEDIQREVKSGN